MSERILIAIGSSEELRKIIEDLQKKDDSCSVRFFENEMPSGKAVLTFLTADEGIDDVPCTIIEYLDDNIKQRLEEKIKMMEELTAKTKSGLLDSSGD